jgi:hypothetical protein
MQKNNFKLPMGEKDKTRQKLSFEEWNPDFESKIPDWQLMAMLHYEYARCSKLMLKAVSAIRDPGKSSKAKEFLLPFANDLARQFPEFPKTPWGKITSNTRLERLAILGINEQNGLYSAPLPGWESWEFFDPEPQNFKNELTDLASESYGIFKIDFNQEDSVIQGLFYEWLKKRREFLLKKHLSTVKLAPGINQNTNDCFRGRPPGKRENGRGAPPNKYRLALTALGKLRAFIHADRDVELANQMGQIKDLSSWHKYETYAARMMICVQSAWKCRAGIVDVFDGKNLKNNIGFSGFIYPPKSLDEPRQGKVDPLREFLDRNFTLAELKHA